MEVQYHNLTSELLEGIWKATWSRLQEGFWKARIRMARWHNQHRKEQPSFKVNDLVMLNNRYIPTKHPSRKLGHKKIGPLKIIEAVGNRAYRLELSAKSAIHNVFHVSLLEPYRVNSNLTPPTSTPQHPIPEIIAGEENWVVRGIVESRRNNRKRGQPVEYLVLWGGYPDEDTIWESWEHIQGTAEEV